MRLALVILTSTSFLILGLGKPVHADSNQFPPTYVDNGANVEIGFLKENCNKLQKGRTACTQLGLLGDDDSLGKGSLKDCLKKVTCKPQAATSNQKASSDDDDSDDDDGNSFFCQNLNNQTLVDSLNSNIHKEKTSMEDDIKAFQKVQDDIQRSAREETKTEADLQKRITDSQSTLQQKLIDAQDTTNKIDQRTQQELTSLQGDLQKLRNDAQKKITSDRQQIINKYMQAVDAARLACANRITAMATSGQLSYQNQGALLASSRTGSVNYQCNQDRAYRYQLQEAQSDMLQALQALEQSYNDDEADITKTTRQMANVAQRGTNEKNTTMMQAKTFMNRITLEIQNSVQQLAQAKQQFMTQQQTDRQRLMQAQQQQQISSSQYQKDFARLQQLENAGYTPNANDKKASKYSELEESIEEGVAFEPDSGQDVCQQLQAATERNSNTQLAQQNQSGANRSPSSTTGNSSTTTVSSDPSNVVSQSGLSNNPASSSTGNRSNRQKRAQ